MTAYSRALLKFVTAVVALVTFLDKQALAEEENYPFCFDGEFRAVDGSVSGDYVDLTIDVDSLVGKELIIVSHFSYFRQDSNEIRGWVGRIMCFENVGSAIVQPDGLNAVFTVATLGSVDDYKRIRRNVLENTDGMNSKTLFEIKGIVKMFSDTWEPYIEITDLVPLSD